jgi:hypothetical protein
MRSECERAAAFIDALSISARIRFFARLSYELTIAGRSYWSRAASEHDSAVALRQINELQHQVSAQLMNAASRQEKPVASEGWVGRFLKTEHSDAMLAWEVRRSFMDALAASVKAAD